MQFPAAQAAALEKSTPETFYLHGAHHWKGSSLRAVASSLFLDEFYQQQVDDILQELPWKGTIPLAVLALPLVLVSSIATSITQNTSNK